MPPFASEQFRAITSAKPECVWTALTATSVPLDYLHGMTVDTDWQPGARVVMALTDQWHLTGHPGRRPAPSPVLHPRRPARLAIGVRHLGTRGTRDGTIIRLNVDEPWPLAGSSEDLETAWLPVLSSLVRHLERGPSSP